MTIKTKDGQELQMQLQQYLTGLYVAVYYHNKLVDQLCYDNENSLKRAIKNSGAIIITK